MDLLDEKEKEPFIQRLEWINGIAESWIKSRTVDKEDVDRVFHEIVGALHGIEGHERRVFGRPKTL